jgi:1,4-alpha-glucan branching enzyme
MGSFSLVLHTHLPWVAHHGTWPVGEEWLHQAFTGSWRRIITMLESLASEGYSDIATLGVTPVLAAMMDDPYCLSEIHSWAGRWRLRAEELAVRGGSAQLAAHEHRAAVACLDDIERRWLTGGLSSILRPLVDSRAIEVIGGPATHPYQPLLTDRFAAAQLRTGLADTSLRIGRTPRGIWAPECGYAPGLEDRYTEAGVQHFVVDGPAVGDRSGLGYRVSDSDVVCFARDRPLSSRIWSARTGYPAGPEYRDFHTFDHSSGFRPARVTGLDVEPHAKLPWDCDTAMAAVHRDAHDFVGRVVERLRVLRSELGREGLVVAAFDTELFGHWWYEGPEFLAYVLRLLPEHGVRHTTLEAARDAGLIGGRIDLPASSWGAGQDSRLWDNDEVSDLVSETADVQKRLFALLDASFDPTFESGGRSEVADQLAREAMLLSSSDWAFMVSRESAAEYARGRATSHARRFQALADLVETGDRHGAAQLARSLRAIDGPFGQLDARLF